MINVLCNKSKVLIYRIKYFVLNRINEFRLLHEVSLSKLIHSVLSEVAHPYYVVFGGCREWGKRTIFAVGTGALQKACFELQPGICLGVATKLLYGLV